MQPQKILIVDDESSIRTSLFRLLDRQGYRVITSSSKQEAATLYQSGQQIDLAIIDLKLPDGCGLEVMNRLKVNYPDIKTIILTGYGSIEAAVRATREGALHFFTKPFNNEELLASITRALMQNVPNRESIPSRNMQLNKSVTNRIIGESAETKNLLALIDQIADSDSNVLITGESGTGKELVAKALHYKSKRHDEAFVPINCSAIPAELLESELFGHVKGAFTGAINNRVGRFEMANRGTILLDEIGEMSPSLQAKLLRVLQEKHFEPVGATKSIEVNVRVIAATNVNLEKAVAEGRFREDLYYRLNVIPVQIPPLRDRRSDIPILINHFVTHFNSTKCRNITGFSAEALASLCNFDWPGNIRELENLIERLAIIKNAGEVQFDDLPAKYRVKQNVTLTSDVIGNIPEEGIDFNAAVDAYENSIILNALEKTGWNRNQAATLLRLNRTTLVEKIKKKGLQPPTA